MDSWPAIRRCHVALTLLFLSIGTRSYCRPSTYRQELPNSTTRVTRSTVQPMSVPQCPDTRTKHSLSVQSRTVGKLSTMSETLLSFDHAKQASLERFYHVACGDLARAMSSTTSDVADRLANVEKAIDKTRYIINNSQFAWLRVKPHNLCIAALQQRCYLSPTIEHRKQYLQHFEIAASDLRDHPTEYSFHEKWTKELVLSGALLEEGRMSTGPLVIPFTLSRQYQLEALLLRDEEKIMQARAYRVVAKALSDRFATSHAPRDLADSAESLRRALYRLPEQLKEERVAIMDDLCTKLGRLAEATTNTSAVLDEAMTYN